MSIGRILIELVTRERLQSLIVVKYNNMTNRTLSDSHKSLRLVWNMLDIILDNIGIFLFLFILQEDSGPY